MRFSMAKPPTRCVCSKGLRGEGVEPPVILWALAGNCACWPTFHCNTARVRRWTRPSASARPPVWDKRKPLMSKALQRYSAQRWAQLLLEAQRIDAQIKGQAAGSPWMSLSRLTLLMAGQRIVVACQ